MSAENASEGKKGRPTSILLVSIAVILGLIGYLKGEEIMTYVMYLQERWSHNSRVADDRRYDRQIGPPREGEYNWVTPDAPVRSGDEPAAADSPAVDGGSEPTTATDLEMP